MEVKDVDHDRVLDEVGDQLAKGRALMPHHIEWMHVMGPT
jgi:hypothetical protein